MPIMNSTANRKIVFVPTIADSSAPTVAELTGASALDISCLTAANNFQMGATGEEAINDPALCARGNDSSPGRVTYEIAMDFFRWTTDAEDKAWDTFTEAGIAGYLVQRMGKDFEDDFAVGDKVQVYKVLTGTPMIQTPPANGGFEKFRQSFYPQSSGTDERAAVAA